MLSNFKDHEIFFGTKDLSLIETDCWVVSKITNPCFFQYSSYET